jgi:GntR family transcriptional regulator of vanillate catabolism
MRIPFASAHAIAFDKVDLPRMYDLLRYTHRQHHAIVQALENGEGSRVAALMFEHAYATRESINMSRATSRWSAADREASRFE